VVDVLIPYELIDYVQVALVPGLFLVAAHDGFEVVRRAVLGTRFAGRGIRYGLRPRYDNRTSGAAGVGWVFFDTKPRAFPVTRNRGLRS
jgi:hypothetical protein